jgi:GT2 family glycosyltransferase
VNRLRPVTAVVVPTVGPIERLERCLGSMVIQTLPFVRVVVVSDAGPENLEGELSRIHEVEVLRLPRRLGFAGAANAGIREILVDPGVTGVALVNDDVRLASRWHEAAFAALTSGHDIGACATVVLQARDPERLDSAGIDWRSGAVADNRGHGDPPPGIDEPMGDVWGAPASAALFRRSLFDRIGLFDESFTAYQEDVELALRARLFGLRCVFAPAARAEHDGFGSNRPFPGGGTWADFYNARNRISLLLTTLPAETWRSEWPLIISGHLWRLLRAAPEGRMAAVWLGAAHALWRAPSSLLRRRRTMRAAKMPAANNR